MSGQQMENVVGFGIQNATATVNVSDISIECNQYMHYVCATSICGHIYIYDWSSSKGNVLVLGVEFVN
jgi:hypothetical protein